MMSEGLTRRSFIATIGTAGIAAGLMSSFPIGRSRHTVRVVTFSPIAGRCYRRADLGHMANKIYPDKASALSRRPHAGFRAKLAYTTITVNEPVSAETLFAGRKDLDFRVASDMKRLQQFGGPSGLA